MTKGLSKPKSPWENRGEKNSKPTFVIPEEMVKADCRFCGRGTYHTVWKVPKSRKELFTCVECGITRIVET